MLPKIWKKVLLAICIVACLFNITSKLVNKKSLEKNLNSVNDGVSFTDFLKSFDLKETTITDDANIVTEINVDENLIDLENNNQVSNDNDEYVIIY